MAKERPPLEEMTLRQLRKVAAELEISRYSRMRKLQLLNAIKVAQAAAKSRVHLTKLEAQEAVEASKYQEAVEASKYDVGSEEPTVESLATVDSALREIPMGYGESRIVLLPRDPQWAYVYWDIPNDQKESLRRQGGQQLALRVYDATEIDLKSQVANSVQEYHCDELAREWYLPIPISDRDYAVEIGYRCADGRWLPLCRSAIVRVPPMFPSDWVEDHFITVPWEQSLNGQTLFTLVPPSQKVAPISEGYDTSYDEMFNIARAAETQRVAGSLYGSVQMSGSGLMAESLSSFTLPSGIGMMSGTGVVPAAGALGASGIGINYSGVGMFASGIGMFSESAIPARPRQFWLLADAELIVYGATEPDATVTIGGKPIKLSPDGTFRHHMSFQDGVIDYPIFAVAVDGEQNRSIHMRFERQTLERRTNSKEEAVPEWIS
ncbi:MAG: DUF4912 domain-containing protein [Oscillatoriales cyanobacterium SM2_2_1]|nr:DUF4912 domain-containing protein [Oscillatoriales cyanobacterium SM2_2_1]